MNTEYELRKFIADTHDMIEKVLPEIPEHLGWTTMSVHARHLLEYLANAEQACDDGEHQEAFEWLSGLRNEAAEFYGKYEDGFPEMDEGFMGTACWLWTEREFAVPYHDGWFDALAVMTELETTLPDYCEYTDHEPSDDWCMHEDGELWLHESHLFQLVNSADVQFQMFMVQKIKYMLREAPDREHRQASLHAVCPEVHDMLFPDAVTEGE